MDTLETARIGPNRQVWPASLALRLVRALAEVDAATADAGGGACV